MSDVRQVGLRPVGPAAWSWFWKTLQRDDAVVTRDIRDRQL
jgi:hypothetical protein